ncbi:MAG: hypothetical protein ACX939_00535 [Hyphococcus sp.]
MHRKTGAATFLATITIAANPSAQTQPLQGDGPAPYTNPCEAAPNIDFDFWVGDWVAFDYDTGVVQGIDRIEKINNGCVIWQDWSQMTDRYRTPGAPMRYAGVSMSSVLPDGQWQQVWVGNGGGTITLRGGYDESEGGMILRQEGTAQNGTEFKLAWRWIPEADGAIHSWGELQTRSEDGSWSEPQIPWNLRYAPRASVEPLMAGGQ